MIISHERQVFWTRESSKSTNCWFHKRWSVVVVAVVSLRCELGPELGAEESAPHQNLDSKRRSNITALQQIKQKLPIRFSRFFEDGKKIFELTYFSLLLKGFYLLSTDQSNRSKTWKLVNILAMQGGILLLSTQCWGAHFCFERNKQT